MKKYLALSVVASTLLMAGGDVKPVEPVVEAVAEQSMGTVSGQLRAFYIDRTYNVSVINRNALSMGGWVKYESPEFHGLSAAVALYGVNGFNIHDKDIDGNIGSNYDPTLTGRDGESYGFIGEAYLNYKNNNTNVKVGRQKLNTPMAGADDARMLPSLFEAAVLTNTDLDNTTLLAAHVTKMTAGTFANAYVKPAGGDAGIAYREIGMSGGYGYGVTNEKLGLSGDFEAMGDIALGSTADTKGVTAAAVIHTYDNGLKLQVWDYFAHDIVNVVYAQADYGWTCMLNPNVKMNGSVQYINEQDVGSMTPVDASYWGAKVGASSGALSGYIAYSSTTTDDSILSPWGGMPAFTQGMVTRHQFLGNTDAFKVATTYNMSNLNLKASAYYAKFDVGEYTTAVTTPTTAYAHNTTSEEKGLDIIYQTTKDLQLRFRANFPTDFSASGTDWDEYRVIANYNF